MNKKNFIFTSLIVFVAYQVINFVIHSLILMGAYQVLEHVFRPDMMQKMWIIYVTSLIFAFLFVYIFSRGYEGKGIAEGVRYGLIIGLLMNVVGMFNQYAVYPITFSLTIQWFIYGVIQYIICGIVAAALFKPAK
jgi:tryptophan-rich sensory protein